MRERERQREEANGVPEIKVVFVRRKVGRGVRQGVTTKVGGIIKGNTKRHFKRRLTRCLEAAIVIE